KRSPSDWHRRQQPLSGPKEDSPFCAVLRGHVPGGKFHQHGRRVVGHVAHVLKGVHDVPQVTLARCPWRIRQIPDDICLAEPFVNKVSWPPDSRNRPVHCWTDERNCQKSVVYCCVQLCLVIKPERVVHCAKRDDHRQHLRHTHVVC